MNLINSTSTTIRRIVILTAIVVFCYTYNNIQYPNNIWKFNEYRNQELKKYLDNKIISLIQLTTSGNTTYKVKDLFLMYKELEILHLLVISGSNISVFLLFTYFFIGRKNMTELIFRFIILAMYSKFIGYPEPLVRAMLTNTISDIRQVFGIKSSLIKELFIVFILSLILSLALNTGNSYLLSLIFSTSITIYNRIFKIRIPSKLLNFLLFSCFMSFTTFVVSLFFFDVNMCVSFISNLLITPIYDVITIISYVVYFLPIFKIKPLEIIYLNIFSTVSLTFNTFFNYLGIIETLSHQICR